MHYFLEPLENRQLLAELVDEADVIFHLAAAVGVKLIVESPVRTIETNVNGTQMVLEAACRKRKLVFAASTSEVYGKNTNVPFHEDADLVLGPTTKGRWSYAASKALDEFLALSYWKEKRLPVVVARFFNTVGPRQTGRYGMVLPNFVRQALEGAPITVYGTGKQSRCFCDVRTPWKRSAPGRDRQGRRRSGQRRQRPRNHHRSDLARMREGANEAAPRRSSTFPTIRRMSPASRTCSAGFRAGKTGALTGFRPQTRLAGNHRPRGYLTSSSKRTGIPSRILEIPPARNGARCGRSRFDLDVNDE